MRVDWITSYWIFQQFGLSTIIVSLDGIRQLLLMLQVPLIFMLINYLGFITPIVFYKVI